MENKMKFALLITILLTVSSCTSTTEFGECVGFDDEDRNPNLIYKVSVRNAFWSFLGIETIIAPILWATDFVYCPIGHK